MQDFVEILKLVLAPGGVMLLAHQIRRAVSFSFTLFALGFQLEL